MSERKIVSIQYLRGLAALGVVFCHYGSGLTSYPDLSKIFSFGQSGVDVFFLISGFIIVYSLFKSKYKPQQFFNFLLKRSLRIDPSYFVTILLTIAFFEILSLIPSFKGNKFVFIPGQFIAHIFYAVPFTKYSYYNHVFWTLSIEFQFYLIIGLLYFLYENYFYKSALTIIFSLTCLIPFNNAYYLVFTYAPIFALGMSLVSLYSDKSITKIILPILLLCLVEYKFGLSIFILITMASIAIFLLKLAIQPLKFLGDISYSLYLTHSLLFMVFLGLTKRTQINLNTHELFWFFVEVLMAILFAYVFYTLIERPSTQFSKRFAINDNEPKD